MQSRAFRHSAVGSLAAAALLMAMAACSRSVPEGGKAPSRPGPGGAGSKAVTESLARARGREVSKALAGKLMTQLTAALEAGGPAEAVRVCQTIAHPITEGESSMEAGIRVRRTARRIRNPENTPDAMDREILDRLHALRKSGKPFPEEIVSKEGEGFRYYKPLPTKSLCLQCHGDRGKFDPSLKAKLAELYPGDKAFGFAEGDLRGVIRVDIQPPANP